MDGNIQLVMERVASAFVLMFIVALVVERSLAALFDYRLYKTHLNGKGLKLPITLGICIAICYGYPFDAMGLIFGKTITTLGQLITAGFLAGGSKKIAETFGDLKRSVVHIQESKI